ncbi:trafficking regulator of GLUT4 1 [Polypterus senegalus]|uniref:trafficking regulator of GLUT4 1 n=1 Tax=Polypterus senegalus TaxID=55291 RepID=UPI001966A1D9|nr:trafficking regulator of GLUT4 1 [Polypterus senegalus]
MAINTDAHFEKESLGGGGSSLPTDSQETDKLLNAASEAKGENGLKSPDSYSVSMQESDQNGHGMQFRSSSSGQLGDPQLSPSRVSLARASSSGNTAQENQRPRDYLILAILSCFCPIWPVNIVGLVYSIMSRYSLQQGDVDGARRLGLLARLLSIVSIVLGIIIITLYIVLNFTVYK